MLTSTFGTKCLNADGNVNEVNFAWMLVLYARGVMHETDRFPQNYDQYAFMNVEIRRLPNKIWPLCEINCRKHKSWFMLGIVNDVTFIH